MVQLSCPEPQLHSTAVLFGSGAILTAGFSGSLFRLTQGVNLSEVLLVGMVVPSFTWLVQLGLSFLTLSTRQRNWYWRDLGWVCLIGSAALLPGAALNVLMPYPPLWMSAANVLLSVAIMAAALWRLSTIRGRSWKWPLGWITTIVINMALFVWASSSWW